MTAGRRLEKYASRGWAIAVPGFDASRVRPELLQDNYVFMRKNDLLLRVQPRAIGRQGLSIDTLHVNGRALPFTRTSHITVSAVQAATSIRGFERLVVLDRGIAREVSLPSIRFCEKHSRIDALPAKATGTCVPLVTENGHYMLLWGADAGDSDSDDDVSETPRASVYALLEKHFSLGLDGTDETPQNSDAMIPDQWIASVTSNAMYEPIINAPCTGTHTHTHQRSESGRYLNNLRVATVELSRNPLSLVFHAAARGGRAQSYVV